MSLPLTDSPAQLCERLRAAIEEAIPEAAAEIAAISPGHFEVRVTSAAFEGKGMVDQQRMVYTALRPFMTGDAAPVHAIDQLQTRTPAG